MTKGRHPDGNCFWTFNMNGLCDDLSSIEIDFIAHPWNAAQRFYGYLRDFGLESRL